MNTRLIALREYLEAATARPFSWDGGDCILWAADWAVVLGHADPAARFRGRYKTALGARRLIKRHGGLEALVSAAMGAPAAVGATPRSGDVGLVGGAAADPSDLIGAIHVDGGRWAVKTARGVRIASFSVHSFWSL